MKLKISEHAYFLLNKFLDMLSPQHKMEQPLYTPLNREKLYQYSVFRY